MLEQPLVSVIIPTVPNDPFIDGCVKSIKKSTYSNIEIIIIDEGKPRSEQRNIGISRAKGEYLLFLDADQRVSTDLIGECVEFFGGLVENTAPGVLYCIAMNSLSSFYIPEIITTKGWFAKLRNWERQFYTGTAIDVVRFIRAGMCPKFSTELDGPEDSDFDRRVKGEKATSNNVVYHHDNVSLISYFKKKAHYSKSMRQYAKKWPDDKILNWRWRCFGVFLENGKWKQFIARPDLAIAVMGLIFVRGIIYLLKKGM